MVSTWLPEQAERWFLAEDRKRKEHFLKWWRDEMIFDQLISHETLQHSLDWTGRRQ